MYRGDSRDRRGYTGRMNEEDLFGKFRPSKSYEAAYRAKADERGRVDEKTALDLVRKHTLQDPLNPEQPFARQLYLNLMKAMGIENDKNRKLKFYNAVKTPADHLWGIDGWFEYIDDDGQRVIVTMDATINPNKDEWKADVIIPEVADQSESESRFFEDAKTYAAEVMRQFEIKLNTKDERLREAA